MQENSDFSLFSVYRRATEQSCRTSGGGLEREEMVYHWHIPCISSASGIGVVTGNTRELLTTMSVN